MTIKEAITLRIARFDLLWLKNLGYTFQEEPEIVEKKYKDEMAEWQPRADEAAQRRGFADFETYINTVIRSDDDENVRIDELEKIWKEKPNAPSPLYHYEMLVINESERIANFIEKKAEEKGLTVEETLDIYEKKDGEAVSCWDFVDNIKADGYDGWDEGHSGNSGSAAVSFALTLLLNRHLYPYMHGALVGLVGDKGYYDDRADVKEYFEKVKKNG